MLELKKIAVTGGLSSGKSSVCNILKKKGAYTLSADDIVHQLLTPTSPVAPQVVALLGEELVQKNEDGQFDRKKIANKVFTNTSLLRSLEAILHPAVLIAIEQRYEKVKSSRQYCFFVVEFPLLYEIGQEGSFDTVIAVETNEEIAKKRFYEKTKLSPEAFIDRMERQLCPKEKSTRADFTIQNNEGFSQLEDQVTKIHQTLIED